MPELKWIGKDKVINHHLDVPYRVLDRKYSFDEEGQHEEDNGSENMIIHGDNLEALKSLLPKYEGKVDCIYIDPPYNTGNQKWVYNDNVNDPQIKKWLGEVVGESVDDLTSHDKWLCMMYPRLKLLWKLLSVNGVILISINDYEYSHLKVICDEVFSSSNFINTFIWYIDGHTDNQDKITSVHEYVLCYSKNKLTVNVNSIVDPNIPEESKIHNDYAENSITKNGFKNPPVEIILPEGFPCEVENLYHEKHENILELISRAKEHGFITREMTKDLLITYPARLDDMEVKDYKLAKNCRVFSGWMNNAKLIQFINNGFNPIEDNGTWLRFYLSKNGVVYYRREGRETHYVQTILENMGTTETNKYLLEDMGINFDYPKPVNLISFLVSIFTPENGLVLDSFAGSGTTAHAVIESNQNLKMNIKFILVELGDYANEVTAHRVKSVIKGFSSKGNFVPGLGGSFSYYELGEPLLIDDKLNENVELFKIREYIYYMETRQAISENISDEPELLGKYIDTAYYFYYLPNSVTTLNRDWLQNIKTKAESYVIYADLCTLNERELQELNITFKKIPRDITRL